ncbi:MAG TPA: PP2C family protein-serine/threonine phosphatase [Phycisphaerae bacterium]|nr:PP2C family protein-serine/threonine phosphatase [Phycisphaerae bacterium]
MPSWQDELAQVVAAMRDLSREKDPFVASQVYSERVRNGLVPADEYLGLSRRGLEFPQFRITRYTGWKESVNPWKDTARLPLLSGGLLADLLYADEPTVIEDLPARLAADDPARPYVEGIEMLVTLPNYDDGVALNMGILLLKDKRKLPLERVPMMVWQSNLFGRSTLNLVLRQQVKDAYDTLDRELAVVGEIQRSLLPARLPETPNAQWAVHYQTSQRAGGDYYDFFPLADQRLGIFLADVSGHGTPAAVMMAVTHAIAHTYCGPPAPPGEVLSHVNRVLAKHYTKGDTAGTFVTAFYAVFDPRQRTLTYANAGHPQPRWRRPDKICGLSCESGLPLGVDPGELYPESQTQLSPGDSVILYTDGITEAMNADGQLLGAARLDQALAPSADPQSTVKNIMESVWSFTGGSPLTDDRTLVVMEVT